ncbi:DUF3168 domain-containing protein [Pseudomonas sp.]|uniref:DUF3168 domain-containing protein n=1 Tax=Pseudomonas sp. TaxID=306 RepID=UPI003F2E7859
MSAERQLYEALSGWVGLAALVGGRIYPDAIPEKQPLPAVVYSRAGTNPTRTIDGRLVCEDVRLAMTAWARTREEAGAVADEVEAALATAGNPSLDRSGGYDEQTGLFAVNVETDWFWSA